MNASRRNKYGARALELEGIRFDSRREAARYRELQYLTAAGLIQELEVHPRYPLMVLALYQDGPPWVFRTVGHYTADFRYVDVSSGEVVVEDVKSRPTRTTAYRLRKRLVEAMHGVAIREVD
jgi:hypothetical protein